jgi:hypothetical protein
MNKFFLQIKTLLKGLKTRFLAIKIQQLVFGLIIAIFATFVRYYFSISYLCFYENISLAYTCVLINLLFYEDLGKIFKGLDLNELFGKIHMGGNHSIGKIPDKMHMEGSSNAESSQSNPRPQSNTGSQISQSNTGAQTSQSNPGPQTSQSEQVTPLPNQHIQDIPERHQRWITTYNADGTITKICEVTLMNGNTFIIGNKTEWDLPPTVPKKNRFEDFNRVFKAFRHLNSDVVMYHYDSLTRVMFTPDPSRGLKCSHLCALKFAGSESLFSEPVNKDIRGFSNALDHHYRNSLGTTLMCEGSGKYRIREDLFSKHHEFAEKLANRNK